MLDLNLQPLGCEAAKSTTGQPRGYRAFSRVPQVPDDADDADVREDPVDNGPELVVGAEPLVVDDAQQQACQNTVHHNSKNHLVS